jgi:Flp pilus assembly pilin Flp
MQDIAIRLAVAIQNRAGMLSRDEEGQTAVEYAGILAVIALIFLALFKLDLAGDIGGAVEKAVNQIPHKE